VTAQTCAKTSDTCGEKMTTECGMFIL